MGSLTKNDGTITGVDSGDAIGAKVVFAATVDNDNTTFRDWVSGETIDISAVTGFSVIDDASEGFVLDVNAADDPVASFIFSLLGPSQTGIVFGSECQYMVLVKSDDADVGATENPARIGGAGDDALGSFQRISNENFVVSIGVGGVNDAQQVGGITWTDWNTMGGSRNNPSGGRTILNGVEGTYDTTATGDPNDPAHNIQIMNDGGGNAFNGPLGMLVIFDEELTSGENTDFDTNSWRIFSGGAAPINTIIIVPTGPPLS